MDNHSLIEVAHMLHKVRSTIIDGERWLMEPVRTYVFHMLGTYVTILRNWLIL